MVNLNSLKYVAPLAILRVGSYFGSQKSDQSTNKFHEATRAQVDNAVALQTNPIANQTHWKDLIGKVINSGPGLLDGKMGVDFVTVAAVSGSQVGLGMLSPLTAALPAITFVLTTAAIAYSEWTRAGDFSSVIHGLYNPDCSADALKGKLAAASKIGSSKSPADYAQFIATMYKIEDATTLLELGTVAGGVWSVYKAAGVAKAAADNAAEWAHSHSGVTARDLAVAGVSMVALKLAENALTIGSAGASAANSTAHSVGSTKLIQLLVL